MPDSDVAACLKALGGVLKTGGELWGVNVRANGIDDSRPVQRPYVLVIFAGEDSTPLRRSPPTANLSFTIKCVADDSTQALQGKARLDEMLNNAGAQDTPPASVILDAGPDWLMIAATKEQGFFYEEKVSNVLTIYHAGAQFRFKLERNP